MAPMKFVFSVILLSILVATSTRADDHRRIIPQPRRPWPEPRDPPTCQPGQAFPAYALPSCRAYVKRKCVSDRAAEPVREECCRKLAAVRDARCRCPAIARMLAGVYRELGVEGAPEQGEAFPGCQKLVLSLVAARLPVVCGQELPLSRSVCSWAN